MLIRPVSVYWYTQLRHRGFIELVAVLMLLAVLPAIAFPYLNQSLTRARLGEYWNDLIVNRRFVALQVSLTGRLPETTVRTATGFDRTESEQVFDVQPDYINFGISLRQNVYYSKIVKIKSEVTAPDIPIQPVNKRETAIVLENNLIDFQDAAERRSQGLLDAGSGNTAVAEYALRENEDYFVSAGSLIYLLAGSGFSEKGRTDLLEMTLRQPVPVKFHSIWYSCSNDLSGGGVNGTSQAVLRMEPLCR